MALRIGKKKNNADDWSEESLRQELAQLSTDEASASDETGTPAPFDVNDLPFDEAGTSDDPLADLLEDLPGTSDEAASTPIPSPAIAPAALDDNSGLSDLGVAPRRRPRVSPILLAAGLVFLIVAAGVGAYLTFFNKPAEEEAPPVVAKRPRPPVTEPASQPAPRPVRPKPVAAKSVPATKVVPPRTPVKRVPPGKAGIVAKAATAPVIAPKTPGQAPAVVPVKGVPTPVAPPQGMAGQPGKGSTRIPTVQVIRPVTATHAKLKAFWKQGAAAKHRGDYAGARRAWVQILRLDPGHPGIQEALNKLPRPVINRE